MSGLILFAFVQLFGFVNGFSYIKADCPCEDPSLCKPITVTYKKEVFAFGFSTDENVWSKFNWTKITTIVTGGNPNVTCHAHKNGARSIFLVDYPLKEIMNETYKQQWVAQWIKRIQDNYMDGVNIDVEEPIPGNRKDLRDAYTTFIKNVTTAFKKVNPNYQITVDVPFSPNCIYGRCYDYLGIAENSDFLVIMDYDEGYRSNVANSNSDYYRSFKGLDDYLAIGVAKEKLVMAFPWYGYDYACKNFTNPQLFCVIDTSIPGHMSQKKYYEIMAISKDATSPILWEESTQTPYFNYISKNIAHQIRYDNLASLQLKYWTSFKYQILGVGMWTADLLDYLSKSPDIMKQTQQMWDALPDYYNK